MALSANAARTLEQVKRGLLMLYGADYFTEDEFVKIDGLLHKGKYVFTSGPRNYIHDEELMSFEESKEEVKTMNGNSNSIQSLEPSKNDITVIMEEQIPSRSSSEGADSPFQSDEAPIATSAETSSDEGTSPPTSSNAKDAPLFDASEPTSTIPAKPCEPKTQPQVINGLPPGITQEQLDEARAMQAEMTKAGKKTRPKYEHYDEPVSEQTWTEDVAQVEEAYQSPAPSERDNRISSWAFEVNTQQSAASPDIESPAPMKKSIDPVVLQEEFVRIHGREPKNINDFYQPNNPNHYSNRPISRASNVTTKTAKTANTTKAASKIVLKITPGSTYIAQSAQAKTSQIVLDIRAGDHIRATKFVSGIMWVGTNLRNNQQGQFSENIFRKSIATPESDPPKQVAETTSFAPSVTSSSIRNGPENAECRHAAKWDEVPIKSRPKPAATPVTVRPALGGGLASSRFSILAAREEPEPQVSSKQLEITHAMKKEFGKMVDEKVDEILKARGMTPTPAPIVPAGPARSRTLNEPLKPVAPKANTCWFWATGKGCRFTAEECRDLHGVLPASFGEPTNLHNGKPSWGALADTAPFSGHADPESFTVPQATSHPPDEKGRTLTCWYWARDGKCNYSSGTCKYLHEHTPKGVAPRPWQKFPSWGTRSWRKSDDGQDGESTADALGEAENGGEMVLEEVNAEENISIPEWGVIGDGGAGGWGRDTPVQNGASGWIGEDDKYKPPHVKALEEKSTVEAVGW